MSSSVSVTVDPLNSKNSFLFLLFMSSFSLYPSSHYYAAVLRSEKVIELFGWWTTYPRPNVACCSYSYISNSHFSFCNYVIKRIDGTLPKYLFVYLSVAYFTTLFVTDIIYRLYIAYLRSWILFTFFFSVNSYQISGWTYFFCFKDWIFMHKFTYMFSQTNFMEYLWFNTNSSQFSWLYLRDILIFS